MKTIEVVAAVITDEQGRIFATQRGYGDMKDGWEFPGGKMEAGETAEHALRREINEELSATIEVGDMLGTVEWDYPTFHLTMHCFWCKVIDGQLNLLEHKAAQWLTRDKLWSVDWLPADQQVVSMIQQHPTQTMSDLSDLV